MLSLYINKKIDELKILMNLEYKKFSIKTYKTRLGSCTYEGSLSFNWKIAMMPFNIINYIKIHELSHLKHFNHSKSFWSYVETYCPDYRKNIDCKRD